MRAARRQCLLEPVAKESLADLIAERLARAIHRGEYVEGDCLPPIAELARQFGVGRPVVREALQQLETVGLVDIRHGSGVFVRDRALAGQRMRAQLERLLAIGIVS